MWLKKADDTTVAAPMPPMPPSGGAPMAPKTPGGDKEKSDIASADSVLKALKDLIQKEKSEGEAGDVKLLEDAVKKVEEFKEKEKKEKEKMDKEKKEEKPKEEKAGAY